MEYEWPDSVPTPTPVPTTAAPTEAPTPAPTTTATTPPATTPPTTPASSGLPFDNNVGPQETNPTSTPYGGVDNSDVVGEEVDSPQMPTRWLPTIPQATPLSTGLISTTSQPTPTTTVADSPESEDASLMPKATESAQFANISLLDRSLEVPEGGPAMGVNGAVEPSDDDNQAPVGAPVLPGPSTPVIGPKVWPLIICHFTRCLKHRHGQAISSLALHVSEALVCRHGKLQPSPDLPYYIISVVLL
eukprot:scaffold626656_cov46-Prasinocladus_malaysianus.AAC.1